MPNARGDGVFFEDLGRGKYKLRWRERKATGGYMSRSRTIVAGEIERDRFVVEIREALATRGTYTWVNGPALTAPPPSSTVLDILSGCIDARMSAGKYAGKTPDTYRSYAARVAESLARIYGHTDEDPIPAALLSREAFDRLQELDASRSASPMMRYAPLRLLLDAWGWAHDANVEAREHARPEPWPGVPSAPRKTKDYLPRTPKYGRTIAPSMAHIDACLRHFPAKVNQGTKVAALIMRYTGLRSDQVFSIRREDVDPKQRTLYVRTGKTEKEKADARTVPLADALLAEPGVMGWIRQARSEGPLFPKRRHARTIGRETEGRSKKPTQTFKDAWEAASIGDDEVPRHVWAPPNRRITRPEHSFRAAFQAFLTEQRVESDVIDFLVGHEDGGVRETHYGRALVDAARRAVDLIPPVDWIGGKAGEKRTNATAS